LRSRRLIVRLSLLGALIGIGVTLLRPRSYTSNSSFVPQTRKASSNLAGVAAQFGLSLPTDQAAQSPAFYADVVTARDILERIVDAKYEFPGSSGSIATGTLVEAFDAPGRDSLHRRDEAVRALQRSITATAVQKTGVVKLSIRARTPDLAAAISRRALSELDRFNLQSRQSAASAERRFTERSLAEARGALRTAEEQLEAFLSRNLTVGSPLQAMQRDRLKREVDMRQQVQTSLAQAYEQAKIDEVRDTPVITVIEGPKAPVRPDSRRGLFNVVAGVLVGVLIGLVVAWTRASRAGDMHREEDDALSFALVDTMRDLRRPWRLLASGDAASDAPSGPTS